MKSGFVLIEKEKISSKYASFNRLVILEADGNFYEDVDDLLDILIKDQDKYLVFTGMLKDDKVVLRNKIEIGDVIKLATRGTYTQSAKDKYDRVYILDDIKIKEDEINETYLGPNGFKIEIKYVNFKGQYLLSETNVQKDSQLIRDVMHYSEEGENIKVKKETKTVMDVEGKKKVDQQWEELVFSNGKIIEMKNSLGESFKYEEDGEYVKEVSVKKKS